MYVGPHEGRNILMAGEELLQARAAMLMIHGRGVSARDILGLYTELQPRKFVYLAPQAAGSSWYPRSFLAPLASNEPELSSALAVIGNTLARLKEAGIPEERVILLGFSQGACLVLEFAARNARRYGGVVGLSGGVIGPKDMPRNYSGSLAGTPIILGCSDRDPHIPKERVDFTEEIFQELDGAVTKRIYPNMGHTVNDEEVDLVNAMMKHLLDA
jgi:phospholipase/carboxylesterase